MNTVYVLITQERDNRDGIEGIGTSVYASFNAAVEAVVQGIQQEWTGGPVTEAEVRALVQVDEQFGIASAFDPWNEVDWVIQKVEVQV